MSAADLVWFLLFCTCVLAERCCWNVVVVVTLCWWGIGHHAYCVHQPALNHHEGL
jgi:hypothetical protein